MLLFLSHFDAVFPTINRDEPAKGPEGARARAVPVNPVRQAKQPSTYRVPKVCPYLFSAGGEAVVCLIKSDDI